MIENFKIDAFLTVINEFMRLDETERALWVCDNMPAFFRDNPPIKIVEVKNEILKRIATPRLYSTGEFDCRIDPDNERGMDKSLRGALILKDVQHFNEFKIAPHIVDYAPGEYYLPLMLKKHGAHFTYDSIELNKKAREVVYPYLKDFWSKDYSGRPVIYSATEIIEHLWHEEELKTEMLFNCGHADIIHISTPKYCFDSSDLDWKEHKPDVGHLRAYTPGEFMIKLKNMFPEYMGMFFDSLILHARMIHKFSKFHDNMILDQNVLYDKTSASLK